MLNGFKIFNKVRSFINLNQRFIIKNQKSKFGIIKKNHSIRNKIFQLLVLLISVKAGVCVKVRLALKNLNNFKTSNLYYYELQIDKIIDRII